MAQSANLSRPVMSAGAGLDANQTSRQARKEISYLCSRDTLSEHDTAFGVDAMRLKHILRDIETHCDNVLRAALL
jgi:translation elongation factor EF-1beta